MAAKSNSTFFRNRNLDAAMSRRGHWHDNAVAESLFRQLKREWIRRRTYLTSDATRQTAERVRPHRVVLNPTRMHTSNGTLSPVGYETRQKKLNEAGV